MRTCHRIASSAAMQMRENRIWSSSHSRQPSLLSAAAATTTVKLPLINIISSLYRVVGWCHPGPRPHEHGRLWKGDFHVAMEYSTTVGCKVFSPHLCFHEHAPDLCITATVKLQTSSLAIRRVQHAHVLSIPLVILLMGIFRLCCCCLHTDRWRWKSWTQRMLNMKQMMCCIIFNFYESYFSGKVTAMLFVELVRIPFMDISMMVT
jgi:hypothetical protein